MKKITKKLLALLVAAIMVMGLSITTFADTTHEVTIYVQTVERSASGNVVSHEDLVTSPITVSVNDGQSYKYAIHKACLIEDSPIASDGWTGEYLTTLKVGNMTYTNVDNFPDDHTYEGNSWMYYNNDTSHIPSTTNDYPNVSLENAIVTNDVTFTLSYEYLIYTW